MASVNKEEDPPHHTPSTRKPPQKKASNDENQAPSGRHDDSRQKKAKSVKMVYVRKDSASTASSSSSLGDAPPGRFQSSLASSLAAESPPPAPTTSSSSQASSLHTPHTNGPARSSSTKFQSSLMASAKKEDDKHASDEPPLKSKVPSSLMAAVTTDSPKSQRIVQKPTRQFKSSLSSVSDHPPPAVEPAAAPPRTLRQSIQEKGLDKQPFRSSLASSLHDSDRRVVHDDKRSSHRRHDPEPSRSKHLARQSSTHSDASDRGGRLVRQTSDTHSKKDIFSRLGPDKDERHPAKESDTRRGSIHNDPRHDSNDPAKPTRIVQKQPDVSEDERRRLATESLRAGFEARRQERENQPSSSSTLSSSRQDGPTFEKPPVKGSSLLQSIHKPPRSSMASSPTLTFEKPPVKGSSLLDSISTMDSLKSTLSSSLALSLARSSSPAHGKSSPSKAITRYSVAQLRSLNTNDYCRPADLRDMTVIELPMSPRALAAASKKAPRFQGKSIGGRGSNHAPVTRQSSRGGRGGVSSKYKQQRGQAPAPVLANEPPVKPFVKTDGRWVPSKETKDKEKPKDIQHLVKTLLNKLTRDRFEKLTAEFCAIPLRSLRTLNTLIVMIMDKALEEPNFAEVYADLCAHLHKHTAQGPRLPFLHPVYHMEEKMWYWTAANRNTFAGFHGPMASRDECFAALQAAPTELTGPIPADQVQAPSFFMAKGYLVVIATKVGQPNGHYYAAVPVDTLHEDEEPLLGSYASEELAMKAAIKLTSFKRLLVTRCQDKFDSSDHKVAKPTDDEAIRAAKRTKTLMLGNMRFLGELFKVELIAETVIQSCLFKLLGMELVVVGDTQAAQTIRMPDEEDLEALCKMLATVGKKFDHKGTKTIMSMILVRMVELSDSQALPSRIRFLLKDILEMRDYQWVPRRKELQQKTLQEVRKEAEKLQKLGKNAQHDDLQGKRQKAAHSSADLAKQNSTLLLRTTTTVTQAAAPTADPTNRIKSILKEYVSLHDIVETRQCVAELPRETHMAFVEQALTLALEGKEAERAAAVDMLVGLYETLHLGATELQSGLLGTLEFLDDLRIDIPMVHEYCGQILGRLIAVGCFGLSWFQASIGHLAESGLAGKLLAEVLAVLDVEMGVDAVAAMIGREELSVAAFLPRQSPDAVAAFLKAHELESFFFDEELDDDDDVKDAIHAIVQEYFVIQDLAEVDACLQELANWPVPFIKVTLNLLCECKDAHRPLLVTLFEHVLGTFHAHDVEAGLAWWLDLLDDIQIDVPQAAVYVAPVVALVLQTGLVSLAWVAAHVGGPSRAAAQLLEATCVAMDARLGSRDATIAFVRESSVSSEQFAPDAATLSPWFS
ncbi:Aste57867_18332 [Aphanomyces stellatus]|uniref:Aste57867_18332 protein n=1 Tax=Aphanomyces stellatus TaxID=120398 RepID=A0A485LBE9_9STRA|nr:hypothetical protein As57867_018270 [Aphanomyces stellatus]VFT95068.1 Aste57867_18332 [Aphanomyces stellatus]